MTPRNYQFKAIDGFFEATKKYSALMLHMATGTGKTVCFGHIIKRTLPKRAMVLAHRNELILQAREKIETIAGVTCGVEKAELYANEKFVDRDPVIVSSIQTQCSGPKDKRRYLRFNPMDFGLLVIDECVPAGTDVEGHRIETLKIGDRLSTGRVSRLFNSVPRELLTVHFASGNKLICTPNHPIWSESRRRFIPAFMVDRCDMVFRLITNANQHLYNVRGQLSNPRFSYQNLLKGLLFGKCIAPNGEYQQETCFVTNEDSQSDERIGQSPENGGNATIHWAPTEFPWWQWGGADRATAPHSGGVGLDNRVNRSNSDATGIRFSHPLQNRCWTSSLQNSSGDRRRFTRIAFPQRTGFKKGAIFEFDWVDSIEVLQHTGDGTFGGMCPGGHVYNIEVTGSNTYFANGVLVHNCHHAASPTYLEVIAHYRKNPDLKVLGCTATIDRADKKGLGAFDFVDGTESGCYFTYDIRQAIDDGYLVDITQQFVPVKSLDFSHLRTTAGDFNEGDLAKLMEMEENLQGICQPTLEAMFGLTPKTLHAIPVQDWHSYLDGLGKTARRTIVFTVSVLQAELCSNIFSRAMKGVDWVCGKTPADKRLEIFTKFKSGDLHCVVNVGVLTEGADFPAVELISQARPTKSRSLYAQIIGRSTRPLPGLVDGIESADLRKAAIAASDKPFCRILDFAGNSGKHKLITCADILGGGISDEAKELANKKALEDGKPRRIMVTMQNAEIELEKKRREVAERARQAEEARKAALLARVDYSVHNVDPFGGPRTRVASNFSRDGRSFSPKQAKLLRRKGYDPATLRYGAGKAIIGKLFEKNGWKQKAPAGQAARMAVAGKDPF